MVQQFEHHPEDGTLWPQYDSLDVLVLCLLGADSDLLAAETAEAMAVRGLRARVVTIVGCGHAPAFNVAEQMELVAGIVGGVPG